MSTVFMKRFQFVVLSSDVCCRSKLKSNVNDLLMQLMAVFLHE